MASQRMKPGTNPSFTNGVPELLILRLLARREMYGYELVKAMRDVTAEALTFGEGVIYPVLHGLERRGCLASREKEVEGRIRVYYRLTRKGRTQLEKSAKDWSRVAAAVQTVLGGKPDARPAV